MKASERGGLRLSRSDAKLIQRTELKVLQKKINGEHINKISVM